MALQKLVRILKKKKKKKNKAKYTKELFQPPKSEASKIKTRTKCLTSVICEELHSGNFHYGIALFCYCGDKIIIKIIIIQYGLLSIHSFQREQKRGG